MLADALGIARQPGDGGLAELGDPTSERGRLDDVAKGAESTLGDDAGCRLDRRIGRGDELALGVEDGDPRPGETAS